MTVPEVTPFLFRNEFVGVDSLEEQRRAERNDKRLDEPIVVRVTAGVARVEVAAESDDAELLRGQYHPQAQPEDVGVQPARKKGRPKAMTR